MEDNLLFKKQIRFNTNDFCAGNILPNVVFKAFETIATEHANLLGVGGEQMLSKNLFWVVMRAKYQIVGNILPNEPIILSTAPQTTNMFEFDRDFFIHDQNGNLLLKGTSKWCVVDAKTRRLTKMTDLCLPVASHIDRAFDQRFLKTQIFETDFSPDYVFAVKHEHIDGNGHMNNSVYAKIVFDSLRTTMPIKTFQINFLREAICGERLDVFVQKQQNQVLVLGKKCEKENSFSACVTYFGQAE